MKLDRGVVLIHEWRECVNVCANRLICYLVRHYRHVCSFTPLVDSTSKRFFDKLKGCWKFLPIMTTTHR